MSCYSQQPQRWLPLCSSPDSWCPDPPEADCVAAWAGWGAQWTHSWAEHSGCGNRKDAPRHRSPALARWWGWTPCHRSRWSARAGRCTAAWKSGVNADRLKWKVFIFYFSIRSVNGADALGMNSQTGANLQGKEWIGMEWLGMASHLYAESISHRPTNRNACRRHPRVVNQ